jgi:[acyl-carrier-protein] S-malonyltransferase
LQRYIEEHKIAFKEAQVPIVSNTLTDDEVDPRVITHGDDIKAELTNQLSHPVLWSQTIRKIVEENQVKRVIIFGPGKITQKIITDEYPEVKVCRVEDLQTLEETLEELKHPGRKIEGEPEEKHSGE